MCFTTQWNQSAYNDMYSSNAMRILVFIFQYYVWSKTEKHYKEDFIG